MSRMFVQCGEARDSTRATPTCKAVRSGSGRSKGPKAALSLTPKRRWQRSPPLTPSSQSYGFVERALHHMSHVTRTSCSWSRWSRSRRSYAVGEVRSTQNDFGQGDPSCLPAHESVFAANTEMKVDLYWLFAWRTNAFHSSSPRTGRTCPATRELSRSAQCWHARWRAMARIALGVRIEKLMYRFLIGLSCLERHSELELFELGTCCPESGLGGLVEVVVSQAGSKGKEERGVCVCVRARACVRVCVRVTGCDGVGWSGIMSVFNVCTCVHACKAQVWWWFTVHKVAFKVDERRQASLQQSIRAQWVVQTQRTREQVHGLLLSVGTSFRLRNSK